MGATFKEDVSDIRNSKVADIIKELKSFGINTVDVVDPYASSEELLHEYGFSLVPRPNKEYDAVIVAVAHKPYLTYDESFFTTLLSTKGVLIDVKGIYRRKINSLTYWSL